MSEKDAQQLDTLRAGAVTTDYAANIAAGLSILAEKWNQLKALGMSTNGGEAAYIENWYMALWGYNSGVYTSGPVGLGYFNNPIKPNYPADRQPFLRYSYDDASHPGDWTYQEKILGWAEVPQMTWDGVASYVKPADDSLDAPERGVDRPVSFGEFATLGLLGRVAQAGTGGAAPEWMFPSVGLITLRPAGSGRSATFPYSLCGRHRLWRICGPLGRSYPHPGWRIEDAARTMTGALGESPRPRAVPSWPRSTRLTE
ncbi:hypothetical protein [Streptomyces sp. NPDC059894]|uniref:hypothetical protein n=1 Tax=unclassified Streptomyces TaxID=2593676 RepID=UPI0036622274